MLELIYKKKFTKTIVKIVQSGDTFTCITKSNLQYTHPQKYELLDFTPKCIAVFNGKYFYIHKEKLYEALEDEKQEKKDTSIENKINNIDKLEGNIIDSTKSDNNNDKKSNNKNSKQKNILKRIKTKHIKLPMKFDNIAVFNNNLIAINKKIVFLSPYKVINQLYGPAIKITEILMQENNILAICYGVNDVYLFQNESVAVFVCDEQPICCLLIDKNNFMIGCKNGLYIFDTKKKKHTKKIEISNIVVIKKYKQTIFVGCSDRLVVLKDYMIKQEIKYEGFVNDMYVWSDKLVICTGREMSGGRFVVNKKAKNMLQIYNIQTNEK